MLFQPKMSENHTVNINYAPLLQNC